jgi:phage tail sheath gpL-like
MPASIVLTGLASNDPVPGVYIETNFAQGPATGSAEDRAIVCLANKLSTGSATVDTVIYGPSSLVPLQTEADMIALAGAGSEAHRMYRRIAKVNKETAVNWVFVTESAGVQATGTFILAGGAATGNGNIRVWVGDEFVDTAIASGDAVDTIGAAIVVSVNGQTHWPVTAGYNAGTDTVTLTAKQKGLRGNWLRFMTAITAGITTTTSVTSDTFFTGGTTADSNTTALATILPKKHYYIVSAAEDATQYGAVVTQVNTQAAPTIGIRQRAFAGSVDTLANATTIATGINAARAELVWHEKSPLTPAELAANAAAIYALFESSTNPRTNFASFGNDAVTSNYWFVQKSRTDSASPTRTSIKSALNNGITPIAVNPNNTTYLVQRITTRSLSGAVADYRIRPAHKVTICDFFSDDLHAKAALGFSGKRIANDPPPGARTPGPSVVTPSDFRGLIYSVLNDYEENDLLQNVADIKTGTVVQRETSPTTRMTARVPLQPVDNLEQMAVAVDQVA